MPGGSVLIIPAAGSGTRLRAAAPKVLVPVNGRPALDWLLDLYRPVVDRVVAVVHPSAEAAVREHCAARREDVLLARQEAPTGMLDAILAPLGRLRDAAPRRIWITWCDQVAVHPDTVAALARAGERQPPPALAFPTASGPQPYIHLARDADGRIREILHRREGDRMPEAGESDMGLFSLSAAAYFERLVEFARDATRGAATGERNFLPFIPWLSARGDDVCTFPCRDAREAVGVNTIDDLREVERYLLERGAAASGPGP